MIELDIGGLTVVLSYLQFDKPVDEEIGKKIAQETVTMIRRNERKRTKQYDNYCVQVTTAYDHHMLGSVKGIEVHAEVESNTSNRTTIKFLISAPGSLDNFFLPEDYEHPFNQDPSLN